MEGKTMLDLENVAGGALQEKAQQAIAEVVENLQDPDTPWKNKREVVIRLAFTQNEDRDDATCEISVSKKLAQVKPVETKFSIGKDLRDGDIYMEEYGPQVRGQMCLDDWQKEQIIGGDIVDTDTGEVTGKITKFGAKEA